MKRVLFLCTHNSSRSQMAEGLLRHLGRDSYEVESAGTEKTKVQPLAIEAMRQIGIDISSHSSKTLEVFLEKPFDAVVTVCDAANETCPLFPKAKRRLHWSFPDPTKASGTEDERLRVFCEVRDQIRRRVEDFLEDDGKN